MRFQKRNSLTMLQGSIVDIQEKTRKEERRIHPFLFLVLLSAFALTVAFFWHSWQERMDSAQIQNIVRSEDIGILLNNSSVLQVIFQAKESDIVDQVIALESEIKQVYPQELNISQEDASSHMSFEDSLDPVQLALRDIIVLQGADGVETWRLKAQWATLRQKSSLLSMYKPRLLYTPKDKVQKDNLENKEPNFDDKQEQGVSIGQMTGYTSGHTSGQQEQEISDISPLAQEEIRTSKNLVNLFSVIEENIQNTSHDSVIQENFEIDSPDIVSIKSDRGIVLENSKIFLKDNVFAKQNLHSIQGEALNFDDDTKIVNFPSLSHIQSENIVGNANSFEWHLEKNLIFGSGDVVMVWTPKS